MDQADGTTSIGTSSMTTTKPSFLCSAWKGLFQHKLDGPPMDDYHDFKRRHGAEIEAWRQYGSPVHVSIIVGSYAIPITPTAGTATPATPCTSTITGTSGSDLSNVGYIFLWISCVARIVYYFKTWQNGYMIWSGELWFLISIIYNYSWNHPFWQMP